jgi:hypothetical protein
LGGEGGRERRGRDRGYIGVYRFDVYCRIIERRREKETPREGERERGREESRRSYTMIGRYPLSVYLQLLSIHLQ